MKSRDLEESSAIATELGLFSRKTSYKKVYFFLSLLFHLKKKNKNEQKFEN